MTYTSNPAHNSDSRPFQLTPPLQEQQGLHLLRQLLSLHVAEPFLAPEPLFEGPGQLRVGLREQRAAVALALQLRLAKELANRSPWSGAIESRGFMQPVAFMVSVNLRSVQGLLMDFQ